MSEKIGKKKRGKEVIRLGDLNPDDFAQQQQSLPEESIQPDTQPGTFRVRARLKESRVNRIAREISEDIAKIDEEEMNESAKADSEYVDDAARVSTQSDKFEQIYNKHAATIEAQEREAQLEKKRREAQIKWERKEARRLEREEKKRIEDEAKKAEATREGRKMLQDLKDQEALDAERLEAEEMNKKIDLKNFVKKNATERAQRKAEELKAKIAASEPTPTEEELRLAEERKQRFHDAISDWKDIKNRPPKESKEKKEESTKKVDTEPEATQKPNDTKEATEPSSDTKPKEAPQKKKTESTEKRASSNEAFPYLRTKYLDKSALEVNERIIEEAEDREEKIRDKIRGLQSQLSEIQALREIQKKGLEGAKNRLGESWVAGKVERRAQQELADMARREESIKKDMVREERRLADATRAKESYQRDSDKIRARVAERMKTFVTPLEEQIEQIKQHEAQAQARIDRFKAERMHLSERLLDAKEKMEQAPLESVAMPWKTWIKKGNKLLDNVDDKLRVAEARQAEYTQQRVSLETQVNKWKELGEAFEKKTPKTEVPPEEGATTAQTETAATGAKVESGKSKVREVPDELRNYIERWNRANGTSFRLTDDIAKWIPKPDGRELNQTDIERGVSQHFTVRRRGIWNWPVFSWFANWNLNRRIKKLQRNR